jgi:hypothetical protein
MIFFREAIPGVGIDDAERLLGNRGLQVFRTAEILSVCWEGGPKLSITKSVDAHVADEAAEIAEGTSFASEMSRCNARFEISIAELDETLDEINTLIEVQCTLQDATAGYLFNSWNAAISGPEQAG